MENSLKLLLNCTLLIKTDGIFSVSYHLSEWGGDTQGRFGQRGTVPLIRSSHPDPVKTKNSVVHYVVLFQTRDLINFYAPFHFTLGCLSPTFTLFLKNSVPKRHLVQDAKQ